MLKAFLFLLLGNLVFGATQIIVPNVKEFDDRDNGFEIKQLNDGYHLSVESDDSYRVETVKEVSPEELRVGGVYIQNLDKKIQLEVKYSAGLDGYLASYITRQIRESKKPGPPTTTRPITIPPPSFLPPTNKPLSPDCHKACNG